MQFDFNLYVRQYCTSRTTLFIINNNMLHLSSVRACVCVGAVHYIKKPHSDLSERKMSIVFFNIECDNTEEWTRAQTFHLRLCEHSVKKRIYFLRRDFLFLSTRNGYSW